MTEGEKQKQLLDREIRDMISSLTRRLADLQRGGGGGGSSHDDDHNDQADDGDDDQGVRIITLAGSNVGATMRSELDAESWKPSAERCHHQVGDVSPGLQEHEPLTALVNSNFQAINNSLMLGGSYSTNDPGVHMDVSDGGYNNSMEQHHQKRGRKEGKKKAKETTTTSKSDDHSQAADA